MEDLKYFELANKLNNDHHSVLLKKELHFRGNKNSVSLISLRKETSEIGIPNIKNEDDAKSLLESDIELNKPKRDTPEKELQAWLILDALRNNGNLSFDNRITFITSELVMDCKEKYGLEKEKRDIRNDILGIDDNNNLCIIELKSSRDNEVKRQTIEFEKVVKNEIEFFKALVNLYTSKVWNGGIRKIAVWPDKEGKSRPNEFKDVELVNYRLTEDNYQFRVIES